MARRFSPRGGKVIDMKEWDAIPSVSQELSTNTTISGGALSFGAPFTILRARGWVQATFDETMQAGDFLKVSFGLGIISTDAFNAGSAQPDPGAEPEYPWLWWGVIELEAFAAAAQNVWGTTAQRLEVDTRSMRKVKPGQSLVWVAQTSDAAGAPVTKVTMGQTRVLVGS